MILDGVCYSDIHFGRIILYVWRSPPVVSFSQTCTLDGTYGFCVSPQSKLLIIISPFNCLSKTLSPSLWRGCFDMPDIVGGHVAVFLQT